jgi:rieske iron-sulfur protein
MGEAGVAFGAKRRRPQKSRGRQTITREASRRDIIRGVVGAAGLMAAGRHTAAADHPERLPPQTGDRFVVVAGPLQDQILRPDLLEVGAAQVECFPIDPASGVPRDRNRLNRVLAVRLDFAEMSEATRARSAGGVLIYSAICTHTGCTVEAWLPEKRYLRCPCHLSQFAALEEGEVRGGPARRPLAMIPLALSDDGFVEAAAGFTRKPGYQR